MVHEPQSEELPRTGEVRGLAEAVARYGRPAVFVRRHAVSSDEAWRYREMVARKRAGEVVLLLRRRNGRYLVHTKGFYPPGTYRLLSGGIAPGEDLVAAVRREVAEETSLQVCVRAFLAAVEHRFHRRDAVVRFASHLFLLEERGGTLRVADEGEDITGYRELTLAEVVALADALEALPPGWDDWGRYRASMHRVVGEVMGGA